MDEKRVEKGLNIKLNFENAHDKLNWNFLFRIKRWDFQRNGCHGLKIVSQ